MSAQDAVRSARTALFVPGDRPDRFGSALELDRGIRALARINTRGGESEVDSLLAISHRTDGHGLLGVVVPKAESVQGLAHLRSRLHEGLALIGLTAVVQAFQPTDDEIDWARRVDGTMGDLPVVERARRILAAAGQRA